MNALTQMKAVREIAPFERAISVNGCQAASLTRLAGCQPAESARLADIPYAQLFNRAIRILSSQIFAFPVIVGVGFWLLVIPAFTGALGANPEEKLLHQTGEIAIWTLGVVLSLSPLRVLFPHSRLINALNRRGENCLAVPTSGARLEVHPFFREDTHCSLCELMPPLASPSGVEHRFRVFLPPGYHENTLKRYPVLYMHDGHNLFLKKEAFAGNTWR